MAHFGAAVAMKAKNSGSHTKQRTDEGQQVNKEEGTDAKRFFDECLCQEEAGASRWIVDIGLLAEDLVAQFLMVMAEETD